MSESASALFSIADAGEFRFARFYIVCEEVPLGTPESPPIVSGVSDMHPSDCPNVEETRNPMQTFSRKKCSHFSPTNIPSAFPHEIPKCVSNNITYQSAICLLRQFLIACRFCSAKNEGRIYISEVILGEWHVSNGFGCLSRTGKRL